MISRETVILKFLPKLYIPSALNIDLILWHTQLIVCAENVKSWLKSRVIHFTFQAYTLPQGSKRRMDRHAFGGRFLPGQWLVWQL